MANRVNALEERLHRVEEMTLRITDAAAVPARPPEPNEVWWEHVVSFFGEMLFHHVKISQHVFRDVRELIDCYLLNQNMTLLEKQLVLL